MKKVENILYKTANFKVIESPHAYSRSQNHYWVYMKRYGAPYSSRMSWFILGDFFTDEAPFTISWELKKNWSLLPDDLRTIILLMTGA